MEDKITLAKIDKYLKLSERALKIARKKIIKGKEKDAREIIEMVSNYLSDAKHFKAKGDFVNAFAAVNYAHGWIDSGVRLGIFNVKNTKLFTVR